MPAKTPIEVKIQNMLDELPDVPNDRREYHMLSKQDARWLANMILLVAEAQPCSFGITEEQATALKALTPDELHNLKDMTGERKKILALLGAAIVTFLGFIAQKVIDAIDPHFWGKLFHLSIK